jgi:ABC-2 type transport system ATP-binding protein
MIHVNNLSKTFVVHQKEPGFWGSVKSLTSRNYIHKQALKNINLKISDGEIIGLIGANGAGKTTLIKILSGIIHPSSGDVSVIGYNPWDRNDNYRRQMSLIMGQKAQLWWDLPALDSFLLLKEIYQIPHQQYLESVSFLADSLMIKDQLKVQVRKLSLGERMKVELMAALLHRPKVVYLDEPTIGLDLMAQKAVRDFVKNYRKEFNPMMILTSHYMEDIEELCQRVVIMQDGSFIFDGQLDDIKSKFAKTKLIRATSTEYQNFEMLRSNMPKDLGDLSFENDQIIIHSPRHRAMEAASYLLSNIKILDLNINEEDIGDIIEHIMRKGAVGA